MRQARVWSYTAVHGAAGRISHLTSNAYVCDQESLAWLQCGLQATNKTNAEHSDELIVLPQPEDTLGGALWPHAALQQHHLLLLQDTSPDSTGGTCQVLVHAQPTSH
jgi:hypothetical protein